jgi:hypothetical protein
VKGQGKFIVVLVDLVTYKLVGLVPSRTQSEINKVMEKWGEKVLNQIEEVSIDMSGNYKSLINFTLNRNNALIERRIRALKDKGLKAIENDFDPVNQFLGGDSVNQTKIPARRNVQIISDCVITVIATLIR